MSRAFAFRCAGAPRDLGFEQGLAARREVRVGARDVRGARWLRAGLFAREARRRIARLERHLMRYFPHMGERLAGLALGARVSRSALLALLGRELADGGDRGRRATGGALLAVAPERSGGGPLMARSLDLSIGLPGPWVVRRSHPEHGYRSIELTMPWLVPAVAGVNEAGLAVAIATQPAARKPSACLAPAALLAQDCLSRFDRTDGALEWCQRRPAGGAASIAIADSEGQVASVIVGSAARGVTRPRQGVLLGLGRMLRNLALEKGCARRDRLDVETLCSVLASHDGLSRGDDDSPCRHGRERESSGLVILEPEGRRLALLEGPPCRSDPANLRYYAV